MSGAADNNKATTPEEPSWWVDFVAGWASGAISVVALQPLDTVLTRFQATSNHRSNNSAHANARSVRFVTHMRGLASEFGLRSLWRGSSPMIGAVPVQNALLMGGYGIGKRYSEGGTNHHHRLVAAEDATNRPRSSQQLFPIFIGGCVGGIAQSFLMSPVEWIKVRQQTVLLEETTAAAATVTAAPSTGSLVRTLLGGGSGGGLWNRGLAATLLRDGIPHGVWFASYDACKHELLRRLRKDDEATGNSREEFFVPVAAGAVAATTAWTVGYPFDIIKTRIQATRDTSPLGVPGVWDTARTLVAEANGSLWRGLYRGFGWKLVRSIPASMIGFLAYEMVSDGLTPSSSSSSQALSS